MRYLFCVLFVFISFYSVACECPALQPISKELAIKYDVIFLGKVDSVSICGKGGISTAYFTIKELYKGVAHQFTKVDFDCASSCLMSFVKDEEWLIYSSYQKFDLLTVSICEHSRKRFNNESDDFYFPSAKRTFEEERQFLNTILGMQPILSNNDLNQQQEMLKPHNDQPSGLNKLWLLLISFGVMGIVFYITKSKK